MTDDKKRIIKCDECQYCKPKGVNSFGRGKGVLYGICGQGGNMVFLEPWREKKVCGSGYIYHKISGCGLYRKEVSDDGYSKPSGTL